MCLLSTGQQQVSLYAMCGAERGPISEDYSLTGVAMYVPTPEITSMSSITSS